MRFICVNMDILWDTDAANGTSRYQKLFPISASGGKTSSEITGASAAIKSK